MTTYMCKQIKYMYSYWSCLIRVYFFAYVRNIFCCPKTKLCNLNKVLCRFSKYIFMRYQTFLTFLREWRVKQFAHNVSLGPQRHRRQRHTTANQTPNRRTSTLKKRIDGRQLTVEYETDRKTGRQADRQTYILTETTNIPTCDETNV